MIFAARIRPPSAAPLTHSASIIFAWALLPWSPSFEDPIILPDGRKLLTLNDPADYIETAGTL